MCVSDFRSETVKSLSSRPTHQQSSASVEEISKMRELVTRAKANVDGMMSQLKTMPLGGAIMDVAKSRDMAKWFEATSSDLRNLDELVNSSFWATTAAPPQLAVATALQNHTATTNSTLTLTTTLNNNGASDYSNDYFKLNSDSNVRVFLLLLS